MYIEYTDVMFKKEKKKEKQQNNILLKLLQKQRRQNPSGYALAEGSFFWLG